MPIAGHRFMGRLRERWAEQKAQYQKMSLLLWTRICLESLILQVKITDLSDVSRLGKSLFTSALVYLQNMTFFMTWTRDVWWALPLKTLKLNPLRIIDLPSSILYWIYDLAGFSDNSDTLWKNTKKGFGFKSWKLKGYLNHKVKKKWFCLLRKHFPGKQLKSKTAQKNIEACQRVALV